jgi:hypothetical protein
MSITSPKKKNISFLLGSGFSVPAGYPTTTELNKRLCKIDASEIHIGLDKTASFLFGEPDPNAQIGPEEKSFLERFLKFYCGNVLARGQDFHYEIFYDYYMDVLDGGEYSEDLLSFLDDFRAEYRVNTDNDHLLSDFRFTFSQLMAQLLTKPLECVHLVPPYYPDYRAFLHLAEELAKTHRVHFHTLNHDLYMEHLADSESIGEIDNGFEELGSPFYGRISNKNGKYMVRLSRFINKFENPFCLYKLHGSIDQFWFEHDHKPDLIKLKKGISNWRMHKEVEENGVLQYVNHPTDLLPDFLTGTTSKITRYSDGIYPTIFNHFQNNLQSSNTLIIIGYGFGDSGINDFIERDFLTDDSKTLFVVDVNPPKVKLPTRCRSFYRPGGVAKMDKEFILNNMNP